MKILVILFVSAITASAQSVQVVSFCKLIENPARYDNKLIRVTAYYTSGHHGASLYDPDCLKDNDGFIYVGEEASKNHKTSKTVGKALGRLTILESRTVPYVTALGRFHDWNGIGHGDLNKWTYELAVMAFTKVKDRDPPNVSEPGTSEFRRAVESLHYDSQDWMSAFLSGASGKPNWMADSFEFTGPDGIKAGRDSMPRISCPGFRTRMTPYPPIMREGKALVVRGETVSFSCPKKVFCEYRYEIRAEKIAGEWKLVKATITAGSTSLSANLCK